MHLQIACAVGLACSLSTSLYSPGEAMPFYNGVASATIIFAGVTILFRMTHIYDPFHPICRFIFELILALILAFLLVAAGGWMGHFGGNRSGKLVVASATGIVAAITMFFDTFFLCQMRNKDLESNSSYSNASRLQKQQSRPQQQQPLDKQFQNNQSLRYQPQQQLNPQYLQQQQYYIQSNLQQQQQLSSYEPKFQQRGGYPNGGYPEQQNQQQQQQSLPINYQFSSSQPTEFF